MLFSRYCGPYYQGRKYCSSYQVSSLNKYLNMWKILGIVSAANSIYPVMQIRRGREGEAVGGLFSLSG